MRYGTSGLFLVSVLLAGCSRSSLQGRVIVLGLMGVDPDTVDLLLSEGQLPHFPQIWREGAYRRLANSDPMLSPILWTTIATGKSPVEHRVTDFVAPNPKAGAEIPVTSRMPRDSALERALRAEVLPGWWSVGVYSVSRDACWR